MAVKLTNGTIARTLAKHLGKVVSAATLIKVSNTTRTPGAVSGGLNPTETSYRAKGWIEKYGTEFVDGSTTRREVRKVALLGASIAGGQVPTGGDKVSIAERPGEPAVTYWVTSIEERDPDAAVFVLDVTK